MSSRALTYEDNKPALALPDFRWLISVLVAEFGKLHEKGLTAAFLSCLGTSMFINKVFLFFFSKGSLVLTKQRKVTLVVAVRI